MSITRVDHEETINRSQAGIGFHLKIGPINIQRGPITRLDADSKFIMQDGNRTVADVRSYTSSGRSPDAKPRQTTGVSWTTTHPDVDSFRQKLEWDGVVNDTEEILRPGETLEQPMTGDLLRRPKKNMLVFQPGRSADDVSINVRDRGINAVVVAPEHPLTTVRISQKPGDQAAIMFTDRHGLESTALSERNMVAAQLSPSGDKINMHVEGVEVNATLATAIVATIASGRLRVLR